MMGTRCPNSETRLTLGMDNLQIGSTWDVVSREYACNETSYMDLAWLLGTYRR
jgi:hypothetical protein